MKYYSTRDPKRTPISLGEAAFRGLATDGGLFMPERIPKVDLGVMLEKASTSYNALTEYLCGLFFGEELTAEQIAAVVRKAYDFQPQLHDFGGGKGYALELFHGPTFAFKDFGARFMGRMFGALQLNGRPVTVLTATSGDTGSAVAAGFHGIPGVDVVLLYPAGRISDLQESQMTTLGANIHPLKVEGSFDDCQRLVKEVFSDLDFCEKHGVTSANSINILRWIPQSFYYFYGYHLWLQATGLPAGTQAEIVVPSGNYGNLSAGMLAHRMGLPVQRFIAASNANDVIPAWLSGKEAYTPRPSVQTLANAMDVGNPSNYERMMDLCGGDVQQLRSEINGFSASNDQIRTTIGEVYSRYGGYRIDPHSAIGYLAAQASEVTGNRGFWLSTAHEAKFREVLTDALPAETPVPSLPAPLEERLHAPRHFVPFRGDSSALKHYLCTLND